MHIRPLAPPDREALASLLRRIETFTPDEVAVALELIDIALKGTSPDYEVLVAASDDGALVGYVCFGPTPMTEGTFDLYWIASDPAARGQGVGRKLVAAMEAELRKRKGRLVRVETSAQEAYGPTHAFYQAIEYSEVSRFPDFYKPGDDLVTLWKRL